MAAGLLLAGLGPAAAGAQTVSPAILSAGHGHSIWTIAGTGVQCATMPQCGDGGAASAAQLSFPQGLAVDPAGNVYVADWGDSEVRRISPSGTIAVVAGNGVACDTAPSCGDGGPATSAQLRFPTGVALDKRGNLYIADAGDNEIRMVSTKGTITRVAGDGTDCSDGGLCGDGGPARSAQLSSPDGVVVNGSGALYIADAGDHEVRKVTAAGQISTVIGDGTACPSSPGCGDGGPPTSAQLSFPEAVALDAAGHVYVVDNGNNEVREAVGGRLVGVAGNGTACAAPPACGDGGAAPSAQLNSPEGLAIDRAGNLYIADWGDNEVRVVSRQGTIARVAGNGLACALAPACGDAGSALSAGLSSPHGVGVDGAGNLVIGDTFDNEVRLVPATSATPVRVSGTRGPLRVLIFGTATASSSVTVRYLLNGSARVSLYVTPGTSHRLLLAARARATAGWQQIKWNRRIGRSVAPGGHYTLTLSVTSGGKTATTTVTVGI